MTKKIRRYGFLSLAVVVLVATVFVGMALAIPQGPVTTFVTKANDDGTFTQNYQVDNAYLISDDTDWLSIVNNMSMWNKTLVLTSNIVFADSVKSIGNFSKSFTGKIYGNGSQFINFTQTPSLGIDAHGLIYRAGDRCELNYVQMNNCSIVSDANDVGGLIGSVYYARMYEGAKVCGCSVTWSNVTSSSIVGGVGGMIGDVYCSHLIVRASYVDRVYVSQVGNSGGMFGSIEEGYTTIIADSWVNGSEVYGGSGNDIGGLIGAVNKIDSISLMNVTVKDCKIWTQGVFVGGMIGFVYSTSETYDDVAVENCTVISVNNNGAGGLMGYTYEPRGFVGNTSWVNYTWVNGSAKIGSYIGSTYVQQPVVNLMHNKVYNGTYGALNPKSYGVDNTFNRTELLESALLENVGSETGHNLTAGNDYGYCGYWITSQIILDKNGGDCDTSANAIYGLPTLHGFTNTTMPGYNLLGYRTDVDSGENVITADGVLLAGITGYTDEAGNWKNRSSTVIFYANWSTPIDYTITYNKDGGNATNPATYNVTTPTITLNDAAKLGYVFEGWYNSSSKSAEFKNNSIPVGSTGNKEFWGNYTANVTTVKFHTDASTEDKVNIYTQAINFSDDPTKTGYTFSHWNVSSTGLDLNCSTYVKDGTWKYTGADQGTLDVYANWTENPQPVPTPSYSSSSSAQTGYTIILSENAMITPNPTAVPTQVPTTTGTPSATTSKSPAPFIGLLAGLGVAILSLKR